MEIRDLKKLIVEMNVLSDKQYERKYGKPYVPSIPVFAEPKRQLEPVEI